MTYTLEQIQSFLRECGLEGWAESSEHVAGVRRILEALRDLPDDVLAKVVPEPRHLYLERDDEYRRRMQSATAADRLAAKSRWIWLLDARIKGEG